MKLVDDVMSSVPNLGTLDITSIVIESTTRVAKLFTPLCHLKAMVAAQAQYVFVRRALLIECSCLAWASLQASYRHHL
jgi:hypothetical protein